MVFVEQTILQKSKLMNINDRKRILKKFDNLSKKELNTKNKRTYVRNDVMTTIIKRCRGEKTRGIRAIDGF